MGWKGGLYTMNTRPGCQGFGEEHIRPETDGARFRARTHAHTQHTSTRTFTGHSTALIELIEGD